jgi:folate-dependent phosphoribosylglycinamide formyltransferase PurN
MARHSVAMVSGGLAQQLTSRCPPCRRTQGNSLNNIVILISGGGSNMAAIVKHAEKADWAHRLGARVAAVVSNKANAQGLLFAREHRLATAVLDHKAYPSRETFDAALMAEIDRLGGAGSATGQPALVVLAGFMRILTPGFVAHYAGAAGQHPPQPVACVCRAEHAPARH